MTTKTITCHKCGATTMRVEIRTDCDDCEHDRCCRHQDDGEKCPKEPCRGDAKVKRDCWLSSAYEDQQCNCGDNHAYGCWIVTCAMRQTAVEHSPMMEA